MFFFFFCLNSFELFSQPQKIEEEEVNFTIDRYIVDVKLFSHSLPLNPHYKSKLSAWDKRLRKYFKRAVNDTENINLTIVNFLVKKRFPPAIHLLGELNEIGYKNITRNLTEAYRYYEIASKLGYPLSLSSVAFYKRYGIATERNILESVLYDDVGAQLMSTKSLISTALQYQTGKFRAKSKTKAVSTFLKVGTPILATLAKKSDSTQVDRINSDLSIGSASDSWDEYIYPNLESLAAAGNEEAEIDIGVIKYAGKYGQKVDKRGALEIFSKHKDNPRAQAFIGKMFHDGEILPKNITKAREYYKKAGDNPTALFGLGRIASEEKKTLRARDYYSRAALKGETGALFNSLLLELEQNPSNTKVYNEIKALSLMNDIPQAHYLVAVHACLNHFPYDEDLILNSFNKLILHGPWMQNGDKAKNLFKKHDYNRSVLIYMELADMGVKNAAYNAGMLFLMNKNSYLLGFNTTESLKTAIRMFKLSLTPNSDTGISQLLKCYELLHQREKAIKTLSSYCSTLYCNYTIQKWTPHSFNSFLLENITNAFNDNKISMLTYLSYQLDSYVNEIHDSFTIHGYVTMFKMLKILISRHPSTFIEILTVILLIHLVRKRLTKSV